MKIFLAGATGATGRELAKILLSRGHALSVVARSKERLPQAIRDSRGVTIREAALLDLSDPEIADLLSGCDAMVSCLGHNLSLRGIYGKPRRLVTEATRRLTAAIGGRGDARRVKFILMSSSGVRNRKAGEEVSLSERIVVQLIRWLVPPHADNEAAAEYLQARMSDRAAAVEWVAVRPDTLRDADSVSDYEIHASPIRSAIFNAGKTSRIHVADFMAKLLEDSQLWERWKGKMPVIYDQEP